MEQTKAKTALLFLSCKLDIPFGLIDDSASMRVSDTLRCISDLQTRIANLEAEKADLERLSESDQRHIKSIEKTNADYVKILDRFVKSPKNALLGKVRNLEAQNKELGEECKWININNKHPKNQQICLLFSDGIHLTFFKFHEKGHSGNEFPYFSDMNNKGPIGIDEITHWKPLPKYPDKTGTSTKGGQTRWIE